MSKINFYDLDNIRNVNENRVWRLLSGYIDEHNDVCSCRDCILDIACITLNNIKPHYQVTDEKIEKRSYEKVTDEEILEEINKAVKIVQKNPHHI
ncbi:MAG: late competence development ComFB family protein [Deferribacterota bacterium]|nr:late competence development ComFB family protein [Deferribacterota bacterium]